MSSGALQQLAMGSGIAVAIAAVMSLVWGIWTYRRNAQAQVQLLALSALQHYLDLAVEHPELASRESEQPIDARYAWFAVQALFTAQTLWTLVGHRAEWQRSIGSIVRQHRPYLRSGAFVCEDFAPEFVGYLRQRAADLKCAEASRPG
jgi:hypothetical protein